MKLLKLTPAPVDSNSEPYDCEADGLPHKHGHQSMKILYKRHIKGGAGCFKKMNPATGAIKRYLIVASECQHYNLANHNVICIHNICFKCNITITNFLVSHTCEIRIDDVVGQSTVPIYSYAKIPKHGLPTWPNEYEFEPYFLL